MKSKSTEQHKTNQTQEAESAIKHALNYLLEEAFRNGSLQMAMVLQDALRKCNELEEAFQLSLHDIPKQDFENLISLLNGFLMLKKIQRETLINSLEQKKSERLTN